MADNKDIMVITGIKMKYLSLKENEYGSNRFFDVLGVTPLQQLIDLRSTQKVPIWDYNGKSYLKINDVKIRESYRMNMYLKICSLYCGFNL